MSIVIEAEMFDGTAERADTLKKAGWCDVVELNGGLPNTATLVIETAAGTMRAEAGDWIIKGVKGEFYPCGPDIFEAVYEEDL